MIYVRVLRCYILPLTGAEQGKEKESKREKNVYVYTIGVLGNGIPLDYHCAVPRARARTRARV